MIAVLRTSRIALKFVAKLPISRT